MADHRNNLFVTKIRKYQGSRKLPTNYMLNDHVQNPNRNNRLKFLHTFGRAELTISFANEFRLGSFGFKDQLMI